MHLRGEFYRPARFSKSDQWFISYDKIVHGKCGHLFKVRPWHHGEKGLANPSFSIFWWNNGFPLNNFCINHEKMALTKFGIMSIKSLLAPFVNGLLMCPRTYGQTTGGRGQSKQLDLALTWVSYARLFSCPWQSFFNGQFSIWGHCSVQLPTAIHTKRLKTFLKRFFKNIWNVFNWLTPWVLCWHIRICHYVANPLRPVGKCA